MSARRALREDSWRIATPRQNLVTLQAASWRPAASMGRARLGSTSSRVYPRPAEPMEKDRNVAREERTPTAW